MRVDAGSVWKHSLEIAAERQKQISLLPPARRRIGGDPVRLELTAIPSHIEPPSLPVVAGLADHLDNPHEAHPDRAAPGTNTCSSIGAKLPVLRFLAQIFTGTTMKVLLGIMVERLIS
jgi:hypothetical protein